MNVKILYEKEDDSRELQNVYVKHDNGDEEYIGQVFSHTQNKWEARNCVPGGAPVDGFFSKTYATNYLLMLYGYAPIEYKRARKE